jgi:hypothetical protein
MAKKVQLKFLETDGTPKVASFPGGVPSQFQSMELKSLVKGPEKKRKYHLEGKTSGMAITNHFLSFLGEMNSLKFEGYDYGDQNPSYDLNSYAIGIYDEQKKSITIQPIHHIFALNVVHENRDIVPEMNSSLSNYDRKHDLTEAFGSKKKKRAMKQQESNTISSDSITGAAAIHDAIGVTLSVESSEQQEATTTSTTHDAASQALAAHRDLMLPPHNMTATTLADAYPIKTLYSGAAHHGIQEWIDTMASEVKELTATTSPLTKWKEVLQQRSVPGLCMDLIESMYAEKVTSSTDTAGLKQFQKSLKIFLYFSSMLKFCECLISNSKDRPVSRDLITEALVDAPVSLLRYFTDTFALHKKMNGVHCFQATKTHA